MKRLTLFLLTLLISLSVFLTAEDSSQTITFQGRLIDNGGSPVNGPKYMGFRFFDDTGACFIDWGNAEGIEKSERVICDDGNYATNIQLDEDEVKLVNAKNLVEIEIYLSDTEQGLYLTKNKMEPRIPLTATPFSISARQIQGLEIDRSNYNPDPVNSPNSIIDFSY